MFENDHSLMAQLIELNRSVHKLVVERYQSEFSLAESAIGFLKILSSAKSNHITQSEIAHRLAISESTLCTQIEKLRVDGLIVRERLVTDRRKTRLELTAAGQQVVHQVYQIEAEIDVLISRQLAQRTDEEQTSQAIQRLLEATQQIQLSHDSGRRAA